MKAGLIVAMASELEALHRAGIRGAKQSGIGKVEAARTATEMILRDRPDCVINSGCAGGLAPGVKVGDIVLGAQTAYHDVWCGEGNLRGQVQGLPPRFDADPTLLQIARDLHPGYPLHSGLLCSGDLFVTQREEEERILAVYPDALACDMESAAIAQVCLHYGVPFLSFRIVSDSRVESARETVYRDFWKSISDESFDFLRELLDKI